MDAMNEIPPDLHFRCIVQNACKGKLNCLGLPVDYNCRISFDESPDGFSTTLSYDSHQVNLCFDDDYRPFCIPKGTRAYYAIKRGQKQKHLNPWTSGGYAFEHLDTLYWRNRRSLSIIYGYVMKRILEAIKQGKTVSLWNGYDVRLELRNCDINYVKIQRDLGLDPNAPWAQF